MTRYHLKQGENTYQCQTNQNLKQKCEVTFVHETTEYTFCGQKMGVQLLSTDKKAQLKINKRQIV
jgi:hypothetical protein